MVAHQMLQTYLKYSSIHCECSSGHTLSNGVISHHRTAFKHNLRHKNDRQRRKIQQHLSRSPQHCRFVQCSSESFRTNATAIDTEPTSWVSDDTNRYPKVTIVAVVPADQQHPLGAPWHEVISHVADRLAWEDPDFKVQIFTDTALQNRQAQSQYKEASQKAQINLLFDIGLPANLEVLLDSMHTVPTAIALDSHPQLEAATKLNGVSLTKPWDKAAAATLPWSSSAKSAKVLQSVRDVYKRKTSDDLLFMLLVLIDAYITEVGQSNYQASPLTC